MRISDWSSDGVLFRSRPILGERPEQIKRPFDRDSGVFDGPKDSRRGDAIRLNAAPHNRLYARLEIIVGESGDLFRGQVAEAAPLREFLRGCELSFGVAIVARTPGLPSLYQIGPCRPGFALGRRSCRERVGP